MSEMVERVARALHDAAEAQMVADNQLAQARDWDRITPWFKDCHMRYARAAIAAMREPTEAMEVAGYTDETCSGNNMRTAWQHMIDEALK